VKLLFFLLATITLLAQRETEREGSGRACKNVCAWMRKKPDASASYAEWI
jgi:hypothetical protein